MSNCDTHSVVGGGVCPPGIVMRPPPPTEPNYSQNEKSHVDLSNAYPEGDHVELNDTYRTIKHHSVEYHGSNETSDYNGERTEYHANSKTGDYNNETSEYHNGTSKTSDETSAEYLRDTIASKENGQINNHNSSENYQVSSQLDEIARKEMFLREEIKREMTIQQPSNQMQQQVSGKEIFLASPGSSTVENGKDLARTTNESYGMSDGTEVASKDMYINERPLSGKESAQIPTVAPRAENFNSSVANLPISGKEMFLTENSDRNEKANSESAVTRSDSNHMQMMDKEICTMDGEDRKDLTLQQHTMPEGFPGPSQMQQMMGKEMFMAGNDYARQNYLMGQMEASRGNTLMDLGVRDPESSRHFLSQLEMAGIRPFPGMRVFPVKETGGRGRPRGSKKQYFDPSERPFKCKLCGKGFRQKAVLMQHDRTHTNERPYSCTECEKAFRQQTHLVQHMRIHTGYDRPFSCPECDKSFRQKTHLIQHFRIHSGDDRPYSCTECSKAFRQKTHLIQHFLIHTGGFIYEMFILQGLNCSVKKLLSACTSRLTLRGDTERVNAIRNLGFKQAFHSTPLTITERGMDITILPALSDNFMYLLTDKQSNEAAIVDPVEPKKVLEAVKQQGVTLTMVLTTHHHWDHAGGNLDLVKQFTGSLKVVGGDDRIEALNTPVVHDQELKLGSLSVRCLSTPCHTKGHMCYYIRCSSDDAGIVFTGDTLFLGGCGRFFEGKPDQMYRALVQVLGSLPDNTRVYCGHEYALQNLKFGEHVEPNNTDIQEKIAECQIKREKGEPSVPSTIGEEKRINPFMRVKEEPVKQHSGETDPIAVMGSIRREKDNFKPK